MKAKILKIKATGDYEFAEVETDEDGGIPLKTMQDGVGGWIERAPTPPGFPGGIDVFLNEEGKLMGLSENGAATRLTEIWRMGDFIVGDVFVCGHDSKGRSVGLTAKQENLLRERL